LKPFEKMTQSQGKPAKDKLETLFPRMGDEEGDVETWTSIPSLARNQESAARKLLNQKDSSPKSFEAVDDSVNNGRDSVNDGRDSVNDERDSVNNGRDSVNDERDSVNDERDSANIGRDSVINGAKGASMFTESRFKGVEASTGTQAYNYTRTETPAHPDSNTRTSGPGHSQARSLLAGQKSLVPDLPVEDPAHMHRGLEDKCIAQLQEGNLVTIRQ
jgi:hypothetical protein